MRPLICIDSRYIRARPSGIGEVVQALIDHLPALAPDLSFLLLRHPQAPERLSHADNVSEVVVPHAANGPATMWYLPRVVDLSRVALFHATFNIMPAGLPMPCVTTVHDIMWLTQPGLCNDRLSGIVDRLFYAHGIRRALRRSAAIATVSDATREEIARIAPDAASRAFVTRSGVSSDFHASTRAVPWEVIGLPRRRRFVLTVGQYAPYKNHEGALAGFARAFADRDDIDLVLVQRRGEGQFILGKQAARLGIAGRVHFARNVGRDELIALYSNAEVLLHPSFCEGFGNPLAEAMACGCPVVTSDRSAMPEVTGNAALLVNPGDPEAIAGALLRAVDDRRTAKLMSKLGLRRARKLSWQVFAEANLAVYRSVLVEADSGWLRPTPASRPDALPPRYAPSRK